MNAQELLTSPLSALSMVIGFVAHLAGFVDPIVHAIYTTAPSWFPALSIATSTFLPKIGTIVVPVVGVAVDPGVLSSQILPVGGLIYVAYLGDKALDKVGNDGKQDK